MQLIGRIVSLEGKQLRSIVNGTFRDLKRGYKRTRHQEINLMKPTKKELLKSTCAEQNTSLGGDAHQAIECCCCGNRRTMWECSSAVT